MAAPVLCPCLVVVAARAWLGTPYVPGGALRGTGVDCVGLVAGILADLGGPEIALPPLPNVGGFDALERAARANLVALDCAPGDAPDGAVVIFRLGRRAHCGIKCGVGAIHACDRAGRVILSPSMPRSPALAFAFPAPGLLDTEPAAAGDLTAWLDPNASGGALRAEIVGTHGETLARSRAFPDVETAVSYLAPWGINVEVI